MEKTIIIAEYLNYVDLNGNAVGHGKKVLAEAVDLVNDNYNCVCICSNQYVPNISKNTMHIFVPAFCQEQSSSFKIMKHKIDNIRRILRNAKENTIIWFTNVDWVLLFFLSFCKKRNIIITLYRNIIKDMDNQGTKLPWLKKALVSRGIRRVSFAVVTNPKLNLNIPQLHIPDYYFDKKYLYYREKAIKKPYVLCTGAMRKSKDLMGVINHFRNTDIEIKIIGGFSDINYYREITKIAYDNISIENRRLSYEEYYSLISTAEFNILPYDMRYYQEATSGILLETVFLNSIPIAPQEILDENNIHGIGYKKISDLPTEYSKLRILGCNIKNDISRYSFSNVNSKLIKMINKYC